MLREPLKYLDRFGSDLLRPGMNRTCGVRLGAVGSEIAQVFRARFTFDDLAYASGSSAIAESDVEAGPRLAVVEPKVCCDAEPPLVDEPAVEED